MVQVRSDKAVFAIIHKKLWITWREKFSLEGRNSSFNYFDQIEIQHLPELIIVLKNKWSYHLQIFKVHYLLLDNFISIAL